MNNITVQNPPPSEPQTTYSYRGNCVRTELMVNSNIGLSYKICEVSATTDAWRAANFTEDFTTILLDFLSNPASINSYLSTDEVKEAYDSQTRMKGSMAPCGGGSRWTVAFTDGAKSNLAFFINYPVHPEETGFEELIPRALHAACIKSSIDFFPVKKSPALGMFKGLLKLLGMKEPNRKTTALNSGPDRKLIP